MSSLEARGLEVSYGGIRAVKGIDLTVRSGELVCLIGANGAGKTTTLKSLCGMLAPSHGEVLYEGVPIAGRPSYELVRRGISMVPEGRGMFGRLRLGEQNARLALEVSHRGYVMESGNIVLADSAKALLKDPKVQHAYLGG